MTGLTPEERFANHKAGTKAAWIVKRYGLRLLPELYQHLNPKPHEAAAQADSVLYWVGEWSVGTRNSDFTPSCAVSG